MRKLARRALARVSRKLDLGLASETQAERENAVPAFLALLIVHEFVAVALLKLRQALLFGGWVRGCASGCARLMLVRSGLPFCGPGPGGVSAPAGAISFIQHPHYTVFAQSLQI